MENTLNTKTDYTLSHLWDAIDRAHHNISFSSEKRADYYVIEFSAELDQDLKDLGEKAGNYKEKYISKLTDWIGSKGRCISSMITGPANFPVRQAEKANNSERNKYEAFRHWRQKYFTAVNRVKTISPECDLEACCLKLDNAIIANEKIKEYNKPIRKYKKGKLDMIGLIDALKELEISEKLMEDILSQINESWFIQIGTMGTTIRKLKERATILKNRIERKNSWVDLEINGGVIKIEDDRVKIYHDEIPSEELRKELKRSGFKWSRNWGCWCRKHTGNALYVAKKILTDNN